MPPIKICLIKCGITSSHLNQRGSLRTGSAQAPGQQLAHGVGSLSLARSLGLPVSLCSFFPPGAPCPVLLLSAPTHRAHPCAAWLWGRARLWGRELAFCSHSHCPSAHLHFQNSSCEQALGAGPTNRLSHSEGGCPLQCKVSPLPLLGGEASSPSLLPTSPAVTFLV